MLALCALSTAAIASDKSSIMASNGVAVTVYSDSFANSYEYDSPEVKFKADGDQIGSLAFVSVTKKGGVTTSPTLAVMITYGGDWHHYNSAIFRGGENIDTTVADRRVMSCRYGCSFIETLHLKPTKAQIQKYTENGIIPIQVRSESSHTAIVEVPASYFAAVEELANR